MRKREEESETEPLPLITGEVSIYEVFHQMLRWYGRLSSPLPLAKAPHERVARMKIGDKGRAGPLWCLCTSQYVHFYFVGSVSRNFLNPFVETWAKTRRPATITVLDATSGNCSYGASPNTFFTVRLLLTATSPCRTHRHFLADNSSEHFVRVAFATGVG